jgi:RNA polymerase sigma-70 factor (ECF subfamily)
MSSSNPLPAEAARAIAPEDNELVARCQQGDAGAFDELVTRYRQRVYAMIYNMVHNEHDAWDLAQDSFVKVWKSIARFRGQSSFYTWVYRIVMNVTIDWLRKKQIHGGTEFDDRIGLHDIEPASSTVPKAELLPAKKLEQAEIRGRINDAIERLSPEHRAVIVMREIDGLQYEEIAEAMECSIGTVMSRLFYARKRMQGMLKDVYENL